MKEPESGTSPTVSNKLKTYLKGDLFKRQVVRAYEEYWVLCEADLRTLVVMLLKSRLRKIGGTADQYRVTVENVLDRVKPDILIWKGKHPRFWIELKDTRTFVARSAMADWDKLKEHCKNFKTINAGFLIYVARTGSADLNIKRSRETLRLWPISIKLKDCLKSDYVVWNAEYKRRAHFKPKPLKARLATAKTLSSGRPPR